MPEAPDWMYPEEWLTPDDVQIDLDVSDDSHQVAYDHLERKLGHVVVEDRPAYFDKWDRITPLDSDAPDFNAERDEDVEFDAAEAFHYCYRAALRNAVVYLVHSLSSKGRDDGYRPWSPRVDVDESYEPPESVFEDVLEMPETPFRTLEHEPYESVEALYGDLTESEEILLQNGNQRVITTRIRRL